MSVKSKFDLVKFLANLIFKKQIQKQKGIMKILPSDKVKAEQVSRFTLRKLEKNANININNLTRSDFEYLAEDIVNPFKYAEKTPIKSADVIPFRFKRSFADELADASKKGDFTRVQGIMKVDPRFKEVMKNVEKQKMTEKLIRERDLQTKRIPLDTMKYDTPEIAKLKGAERMNYLITSPEQTAKLLKKGVTSDDIIYAQDRYGMTAKDMIDAVDAGFKFPFADGGVAGLLGERPGYQDGKGPKMSRRNFMKIIGGLAALPVVGKLFKFAKPLAKTKAAPIAEEVVKDVATTSSPPAYFFNLVNKIKTLGNDTLPTKDKVIAKKYKNYVMEEDFSGNIEIIKKGDVNNPNLEDVYMSYKVVDEVPLKGKKGSAKVEDYEEFTARPDRDGKMKDVEQGVPDEVVQEGTMFEDNITDFGKASGGLARMLGE